MKAPTKDGKSVEQLVKDKHEKQQDKNGNDNLSEGPKVYYSLLCVKNQFSK